MQWCKIVGSEPYIALNMGTGEFARLWAVDHVLTANQELLTKASVSVERAAMWASRSPELTTYTALAWLEYCNSTQDTYYANLRRKNGHEEPYNVGVPEAPWSLLND
jgi:alpha-N-arabinofuranosidase